MPAPSSLKIAFVADTIHSGKGGGGVVAAHHVIEKLREHNEVVEIAVDADGPGKMKALTIPLKAYHEAGFTIGRPDDAILESVIKGVDLVHLQFPFRLSKAALRIARKLGKPVVAAFHVQPENALLNIGVRAKWVNDLIYRSWVRTFYNRADAVVCPTPFAEQKLRAHGLTVPTVVVSNGISPDVRPAPQAREPAHEGKFLILMAGRFAPEKHQEVLLNALKLSKHRDRIALVIAGSGSREKDLKALASDLPNPAEIGFLSRERLIQLFNSADVFVHCSEIELEGMAVLEAMSVGLPALVAQSSESAASSFALDDDFRFPVGDSAALAARLDKLIEQPELLAKARVRSREVAQGFDFDVGVDTLEKLYHRLLAEQATAHTAAKALAA